MKNTDSREQLVQLIEDRVLHSSDENFASQIKNILVCDGKFSPQEYLRFKVYPKQLEQLASQELFWFAEAMEQLDHQLCVATNFFTPYEIKENRTYSREVFNVENLLLLRDAYPLGNHQWTCRVSVEQLAFLRKYNLIRADVNMQRQSKGVFIGTDTQEVLRKIHVNWDRVKEITKDMEEDHYHYNTVRLNLMDDGISKPIYHSEKKTILIPMNGDVIIPDGNHRILAAERAYFNNLEMKAIFRERYFQVAFTFYDVRHVRDCISQEWKVERVIEKHRKAMENNFANYIVDYLKNSSHGAEPIYGSQIVNTGAEVKAGNGFIIYANFADAIEEFYQVKSLKLQSEAIEVAQWLLTFFNYLSILLVEDFSNYKSVRKYKWSVHYYTWSGYVYISSLLKEDLDWKAKLKRLVEGIDWGKEHSPLDYRVGEKNNKVVKEFLKDRWESLYV